jgi:YHS domain-containing protein
MQLSFKVIAALSFLFSAGIVGLCGAQTDTGSQAHMAAMKDRHDSTVSMPGAAKSHSKTAAKHSKQKLVPQKTCPVMGNQIDKSVYVDYKGKRVYFCCAGCPETFKADPEKYLKVLADRGEAVEDVPKK